MKRSLFVMMVVGATGVTPLGAQGQARTHAQHPQGRPHTSDHAPMDPALHAALHAKYHGTWAGTVTTKDGKTVKLNVAVVTGKQGETKLEVSGDPSLKVGPATGITLSEKGVRWTQTVSGAPCKAAADLDAADHHGVQSLKGKMECEGREMPFALHRNGH